MDAKRRLELPIADALGRVGPTMNVDLGERHFRDVPMCWQDWTLWQHVAIEERYGSVAAFQRMWLGLGGEVSEDDDPLDQAASLVEKAAAINAGESAKPKSGDAAVRTSPLMLLGMPECPIGWEDQAFYIWVLLAPHEHRETEDGDFEPLLTEEDLGRGPDAWTITLDWLMSVATPVTLKQVLATILFTQWNATAGELEGEAQEGEHPKGASSSVGSAGDAS